jgi:FkbM family methyltransferase
MPDFIAHLIHKCGYVLHKANRYPVGRSCIRDVAYVLGNSRTPCIFDVGANAGQTLEEILRYWKNASVHCFEPNPQAFAELQRRAVGRSHVKLNPWALGSEAGEQTFKASESSTMSSFFAAGKDQSLRIVATYPMRIDTLDAYCERESIDHVDLLKTDTQGFDLNVIKGAAGMIDQGKIDMILVEITFVEYYAGQASAGQLIDYLTDHEFLPVCFYPMMYRDGQGDWTDGLFLHRSRTIPG